MRTNICFYILMDGEVAYGVFGVLDVDVHKKTYVRNTPDKVKTRFFVSDWKNYVDTEISSDP